MEFEKMDLESFMPTSTDKTILDELYKETPIQEVFSLEDLLKLEVNEHYKKVALSSSQERFKITEANEKFDYEKFKSNHNVNNNV